MSLLAWLNAQARRWWPLVASLGVGVVLYTMAYVVFTVAEDRAQLREQRDQLAAIIERNDRFDAGRQQRLESAVDEVEVLLVDHFALHDRNTAEKLNEALARIAVLVDRPPPEPIRPSPPQQRSDPPPAPPATSTTPAPSTTTTTSPGQSGLCERLPFTPICRSNP